MNGPQPIIERGKYHKERIETQSRVTIHVGAKHPDCIFKVKIPHLWGPDESRTYEKRIDQKAQWVVLRSWDDVEEGYYIITEQERWVERMKKDGEG